MNGIFAVARYTLVELSRRRILLVFFLVGAGGIALIGFGLRIFSSSFAGSISFGGPPGTTPDPAKVNRFLELMYVSNLLGALGFFALLIAFAIGMTVIYHDLDSGAAVGILSKPVTRAGFTAGKLIAAVVSMVAVVGLLSLEARLILLLFGGGLEQTLWVETVAQVANGVTLMLIVMALTTWMNNIVAAIVAFIYNGAAGVIVALHTQFAAGFFGDNQVLKVALAILYWVVPHQLISDAPRQLALAEADLFSTGQGGPSPSEIVSGVPSASGLTDLLWWVFVLALLMALVYYGVRRKQV